MLQSLAITRGIARSRRPKSPKLAKRQIAPQHRESRASKGFCYGHQQSRLRISSRAVGEHQSFAGGRLGAMQEPTHPRIGRGIGEAFNGTHSATSAERMMSIIKVGATLDVAPRPTSPNRREMNYLRKLNKIVLPKWERHSLLASSYVQGARGSYLDVAAGRGFCLSYHHWVVCRSPK